MQTTPAALSVIDTAKYLSISRAGIYRLFRSGELVPARVGGRTLVRKADADALLANAIGAPVTRQPRRNKVASASAELRD